MGERACRRPAAITRPRNYVAPGVLCLLRHGDAVLLIEGARRKRWAGRLNGVGGGVQPGEHPVRAALREIREETGFTLAADDLHVKGIVHSQNYYGESKAMLVLVARVPHRRVRGGVEGRLRWVPLRGLDRQQNLMPDLYTLIPRVFALRRGELLSGVAVYDDDGRILSLQLTTVQS